MSKKAKAASKKKRLAQKRARRAANAAKYEAWRKAGQNSKSKRGKKTNKKAMRRIRLAHPHREGECGNLACNICYPQYPPA